MLVKSGINAYINACGSQDKINLFGNSTSNKVRKLARCFSVLKNTENKTTV